MARESKEAKAIRMAAMEEEHIASIAAYRLTIPTRLMAAQALASHVGIITEVRLTPTGPSIRFYDQYTERFDETLTYESEEWSLEYIERYLRERNDEQEARARRRALAEGVWKNKLSDEEKVALKEFITYM